jgi:hypothetical protein
LFRVDIHAAHFAGWQRGNCCGLWRHISGIRLLGALLPCQGCASLGPIS